MVVERTKFLLKAFLPWAEVVAPRLAPLYDSMLESLEEGGSIEEEVVQGYYQENDILGNDAALIGTEFFAVMDFILGEERTFPSGNTHGSALVIKGCYINSVYR